MLRQPSPLRQSWQTMVCVSFCLYSVVVQLKIIRSITDTSGTAKSGTDNCGVVSNGVKDTSNLVKQGTFHLTAKKEVKLVPAGATADREMYVHKWRYRGKTNLLWLHP